MAIAQNETHVRWMIRRDTPEVLAIESASFEFPWSEGDFVRCLRQRNCIGMVADRDDRVVGYMIYELHKHWLRLLNFAVHGDHRRQEGVRGSDRVLSTRRRQAAARRHRSRAHRRDPRIARRALG